MLARMPRRTKKSSASKHADHLEEWRIAAKELVSAYDVWCAATVRDRRRCYAYFVDAFVQEELAARRVQHGVSALDTPDAGSRRI